MAATTESKPMVTPSTEANAAEILPPQQATDHATRPVTPPESSAEEPRIKGVTPAETTSEIAETASATPAEPAEPAEPVEPVAPVADKKKKLRTFTLMMALCLSVFLAAVDVTIVTTALPTIVRHFGSGSGYAWVASAYMLTSAASIANWAKFSDLWGRKRVLLASISFFCLGSALAGAAVNMSMLIAARAVQGLGAGGILTTVNIVIGDLYSPRERSKYFGYIGLVWTVAGATGPLLGGAFSLKASWRWCFYINVPLCAICFSIVAVTLRLPGQTTSVLAGLVVLDWLGSITLVGSILMFLLGLQLGGRMFPWDSATILCLLIFSAVLFALFMVIEYRVARYPLVPFHLFHDRQNAGALLTTIAHALVVSIVNFFLPFYFQSVLGANALMSGVWLFPQLITLTVSSTCTGFYLSRYGRYLYTMSFGAVVSTMAMGLFIDLPADRNWAKIICYIAVLGLGTGVNFQSPLVALQTNVPAQDNASVSAVFGLVRSLGGAMAVVFGFAIFANKIAEKRDLLDAAVGPEKAQAFYGSDAEANVLLIHDLPRAQRDVVESAYHGALRYVWIVGTCLAVLQIVGCLLTQNKRLRTHHEETKTGLEGEEERRRIAVERRNRRKTEEKV